MAPRVLVLNCLIKGWNILKWLADDGFIVNGGDFRPTAPGLYSNRIADKNANLIYPSPKIDEEAFVDAVMAHLKKHHFDIVLPVNASEMMALAGHKDSIEQLTTFPFENYHKLLLLHDKKYFFELVAGCCDRTYLPRSWSVGDTTPSIDEIIKQSGISQTPPFESMPSFLTPDHFLNTNRDITYPVIVKTRRSTSSVGVYRVQSERSLRQACHELGDVDIIIQENLIGRGVGISSIRWQDPDILEHFGHKRVREYPISGGASTSREPWDVAGHPLAATLTALLEKLDWHGVVMFEFKEIRQADGTRAYTFLESNPRFWGSVPLAMANGVVFPVLLCRAALGMELPDIHNLNKIRARIFFSDTLSLVLNVLNGRRLWYNLTDYFNPANLYVDDIDFGDLPATARVTRQMLAEFFSRGGRKKKKQPDKIR